MAHAFNLLSIARFRGLDPGQMTTNNRATIVGGTIVSDTANYATEYLTLALMATDDFDSQPNI
jgi:histone acetyltransferase (RNA polymerase elongator complex component)